LFSTIAVYVKRLRIKEERKKGWEKFACKRKVYNRNSFQPLEKVHNIFVNEQVKCEYFKITWTAWNMNMIKKLKVYVNVIFTKSIQKVIIYVIVVHLFLYIMLWVTTLQKRVKINFHKAYVSASDKYKFSCSTERLLIIKMIDEIHPLS
jgi:hypothetical protein